MRMPFTLSLYIGRQFLITIALSLLALSLIALLADTIEMLRRAAGRDSVSIGIVIEMAMLRLPSLMEKLLPFAVLIGGMFALTKLTRSHELVVVRAAGVSVWQFLAPPLILVLLVGMVFITAFNPLSSAMMSRFEQIEGRYITGKPSLLAVSSSGLWLRQLDDTSISPAHEQIIHAMRVSQKDMTLADVIVFMFGDHDNFIGRIDAKTARLEPGYWQLNDIIYSAPGQRYERLPEYRIPTNLTMGQIQDSFADPRTMSFWQLPVFITMLENAGFSALRHRLYWQGMLASPLMLCAMVLVASTFSLRLPRRGGVGPLAVVGVVIGFLVYFGSNLINAFGLAGNLPVVLAAWAPAVIVMMIGVASLLHMEDG